MPTEPTNREILDTLQKHIVHTEERFDDLAEQVQALATHMDDRFAKSDSRLDRIEATMVTKDYLDDKLADLRGDFVLLARKQNREFESLIEEFVAEGRLSQAVAKRLLALEPFPQ